MKILGIGTPFPHDPSAALIIDGKVVAACDEERFVRKKHALDMLPVNAVKFCLQKAGIGPEEIDCVAFPWSNEAYNREKWAFAERTFFTKPGRAIKAITKASGRCRSKEKKVRQTLLESGITHNPEVFFIEHHLAHASSAYHLSGFKDAAIMSIDGSGEFVSTLFAEGRKGKITKIKEFIIPDSLGLFYSTMTEYLGFVRNNGEYKLMGMSAYGDPSKCDLTGIISYNKKSFSVSDDYVWVSRAIRDKADRMYSRKMVKRFGPAREGDGLTEPYIHIAAATQQELEEATIGLMETYLGHILKKHGNLCFAGGCALNVRMNRKILAHPLVKNLFVQPASNDSGCSLGAASYLANEFGEVVEPTPTVYLGPSYTNDEVEEALKRRGVAYERPADIITAAAELLSKGEILGWFQGAMEWGPRALGNRSILAHPAMPGISDEINAKIKFREKWRPFCPSMLAEDAPEILGSDHPSPYMALSFDITEKWRKRIPEAVHVDGSGRPQTVTEKDNPRFHRLLTAFKGKTGLPVLINTSLNRRGEPVVCSPDDALEMFYNCGLTYMAINDFLIHKQ